MAFNLICDICGEEKVAFTDNTTVSVTENGLGVSMFVQTSVTPSRPDCCNECFAKILYKLGKKLKGEVE